MPVLGDVETTRFFVGATRDDHADLARKIHQAFVNQRFRGQRIECVLYLIQPMQPRLTFPIVPVTCRLYDARKTVASPPLGVRPREFHEAQSVVRTPALLRNDFSAIRSWLIRSTAGDGLTGLIDANRSSPSALTFSTRS